MNYAAYQSNIIKNYQKQLPKNLEQTYRDIVNERTSIYYFGYILGFVLAIMIIIYNTRIAKNTLSTTSMVCTVVAVSFVTNYFYYILSPKSDWMLNHINDPQQAKAWLAMYRNMQVYYHSGLVLGLFAVGFFGFAFRCS
jgi:presenilin-like A22 family membrane protease